jgi:hypothetical protein
VKPRQLYRKHPDVRPQVHRAKTLFKTRTKTQLKDNREHYRTTMSMVTCPVYRGRLN